MSPLRPGCLALVLGSGCGADLLPGERVLGDEIPARVVDGGPRAELGASVAVSEEGVLAGASGAGTVWWVPLAGPGEPQVVELGPGGGERVWWREGDALAWQRGVGIWRLGAEPGETELVFSLPDATAVELCPDGQPASVDGRGEAVACDATGVLRTRCDALPCTVEQDGVEIGTTTPGSAVAWVEGLPCWGDVAMQDATAQGQVSCAGDALAAGLTGDHLGVAIAEGRAAGVFNKWQVPARARVVSLDGQEAWCVDRAAERSRLSLAHGADTWVVGVPGYLGTEAREGRLYIVSDEDVAP